VPVTSCEQALHVVPAVLGLAFVAAAWFVACRIGGRDGGAWTVAVVVGTTPLVRFEVELLSDLPSAACMLVLVGVLMGELRDRPRWRIVGCAPLAIAAVYVRYGSCVPVAIIGVTAAAFGSRAIRRRPWPVLVTVAVVVLALLPLRDLLASSARVPPATPGLVDYVTRPFWYFGALAPPLMLLALTTRDRWRRFAVAIGVGDIAALGLETAAQTRYVVLAIVLLVAVGAAELSERLQGRRALGIACGVAVGATWIVALVAAYTARDRRIAAIAPTLDAAAAIRRDVADRRCEVIAVHSKQIEWYSGCRATYAAKPGVRTYLVRDGTVTLAAP
jgi:hypothetical protein